MIGIFHFKRIRTKLIFWFLVLGLIPLLLGIAINYLQRLKVLKEVGYEKLMSVRDNKAEQMEYWLGNRSLEIRSIAQNQELIDAVFQLKYASNESHMAKHDVQIVRSLIDYYLATFPEITDIQIVDFSNNQISTVMGDSVDSFNPERTKAIEEVLSFGVINFSDVFHMGSYRALAITVPILHYAPGEESEIIAVMQAFLNAEAFFDSKLKNVPELGETGEIVVVDKAGITLTDLNKIPSAPLRYKISARPAMFARSGEEGIIHDRDYAGTPILAAYTYVRHARWGLIVKQDISEINKSVRLLLVDFGGLLIFSIILLVAMASVVAESISRPIIVLTDHARDIQSGDYKPNQMESRDEIGILARSFNEMSAYIEHQLMLQQGMSAISGALVGSMSMNVYFNSLVTSLVDISKADGVFIFAKPNDKQINKFFIKKKWTKEAIEEIPSKGWKQDDLDWMIAQNIKRFEVPSDRLNEYLGVAVSSSAVVNLVALPLRIDNDLLAIVLLFSDTSFNNRVCELIEQTHSTISIGYANALATDQLSVMANNLFDINQQLEKKTEELTYQSEQLKKSSKELQNRNIQLEIKQKEVESINRMKSEFLSNMSHELRTPLHVILTLSGVIKNQILDQIKNQEELEYLEVIERNGQILLRLISDIMDLSRIEAGKVMPVIRPLPLVDLLQNIMSNIQALAVEKGLAFTLDVVGDIPIISSDEKKLFQVFQNIIGNAIKFTLRGSVSIQVYLEDSNIVVSVTDTGIGIPQDQTQAIFDEFVQVDGSISRNFEGTGLGLAIAHKTIVLLKGSIAVQSELGKGSTFFVHLPVNYSNDQELANQLNT